MSTDQETDSPFPSGEDPDSLRAVLRALPEPVYVVDPRDRTVFLTNRTSPTDPSEGSGEGAAGFCLTRQVSLPCLSHDQEALDQLRNGARIVRRQHLHLDPAGRTVAAEVLGSPVAGAAGDLSCILETVRDLSDLKALEGEIRQAALVFHGTREGIMITDPRGRIERVNPAFTRITGYSEREVLDRKPGEVLGSGWQGPEFYRRMWATLREHGAWQGSLWNRRKNGEIYKEWLTVTAVRDDRGEVQGYLGLFSDLTENQEAEEKRILRLAYFDPLTELPNRATLEDRLEKALARAQRGENAFALLFVDLDGFKEINDRWGHRTGDEVLRQAAERLSHSLRRSDTIARIGGDEFVILLEGSDNCYGEPVARKLLEAFREPFHLGGGQSPEVGLSIGLLDCPGREATGHSPADLIEAADRAMYAAKRNGRNQVQRTELEHDPPEGNGSRPEDLPEAGFSIGEALDQGELTLLYQPEVLLPDRNLAGLEALLRWRHPQEGLIPPSAFLFPEGDPEAFNRLGGWVLRTARDQMQKWKEETEAFYPVAINLARSQWQQPEALMETLRALLSGADIPAGGLELEIREDYLTADDEGTRGILDDLKELGLGITIDDFGEGSMPLSLLESGAITKVKLSSRLVSRALGARSVSEPVRYLETVCLLGERLGIAVVAKGVETREQYQWLWQRGTRDVQGFFFARPQPAEEIRDLLISGQVRSGLSA